MVRRQQNEADRRHAWDSNADYFRRNEVTATKQRAWGSEGSFRERYCANIKTYFYWCFSSLYLFNRLNLSIQYFYYVFTRFLVEFIL